MRDTFSAEALETLLYCQQIRRAAGRTRVGEKIKVCIHHTDRKCIKTSSTSPPVNQQCALGTACHINSLQDLDLESATSLHLQPSQTPGAHKASVWGIPRKQLDTPQGFVEMSQLTASEVIYLERCGQLAHASVHWEIATQTQTRRLAPEDVARESEN